MTKTLLRVLAGESIWPPPLWLMRQAGRYLPEYRALRAQAGGFLDLCLDPAKAAEVTLQPIRRFGFDAAILFSDILILPWALGQELSFVQGEGPMLPPIRDGAGIAALKPEKLASAVLPVLETVNRVRQALDPQTALIGFAGSPWTVACYMVEGGGSRDHAQVRGFFYRNRADFLHLMELITDATIEYLSLQVQAGAEVLMLFDSWAGVLPPRPFQDLVMAPTQRIVQALNARHPGVPVIGFPRLAGNLLGEYALVTGCNAVGMDVATDPAIAAEMVPEGVALQGNLDPLALVAGGDAMREQARDILAALRGRPHIFNLGHGIVPQTPPEHVSDLVQLVRKA